MIEFIAALLILVGGLMAVVSAIGIVRLPDVYTRSHAGTKSSTMAVLLTLLGAFIFFWGIEGMVSIRLILGIVFVFLTAPVSGHLIARASYRSKVKPTKNTIEDDLKEVLHPETEKESEKSN
jgi:multicomponent Na+:H+ antiporter subunit G